MRLSLSLLAATALHGAVFGVAAIVLSQGPAGDVVPEPVTVEVEVVAPRPDPIAETSLASVTDAPSRNPESAPVRPRIVRPPREMASVGHSTLAAALTDSSAVAAAAGVGSATPSVSPSPSAAAARVSVSVEQGGGGAVSAAAPRYRSNPTPDYPVPSRRRREEGVVLLNVQVEVDGTPAAVSLNRSCGHPLLDRAALDAVRRWTFEPARAAGLPISSLVVVPVRFSLADQP